MQESYEPSVSHRDVGAPGTAPTSVADRVAIASLARVSRVLGNPKRVGGRRQRPLPSRSTY